MTNYEFVTPLIVGLFAGVSLILLLVRTQRGSGLRAAVVRALERSTGRSDLAWLSWWYVAAAVAVGLGVIITYDLATGLYACPGPGRLSDIIGFLNQGRALWSGGNPFNVPDCGGTIAEPDGLAAVVINALASIGGITGIAIVWSGIALALVPLTWWVAGPDRRYLTLIVATSPLYFPLVSAQIDGASNALVPVTVLLTLVLATRSEVLATGAAGFLATQRFPTIFPILGMSGSFRRRFTAACAAIVVFVAATGLSYLVWGSEFIGPVFLNQLSRHSFSLNIWGIFLLTNTLPSGNGLVVGQAILTLALVGVVFFTVRSPLRAATITLVGVALLNQFLSFNILVWLLPVTLVGARPRWWLWGVAVIGSVNYDWALGLASGSQALLWPSALLDILLTVFLVGLFVDLWRSPDRAPGPAAGASEGPPSDGRARIMMPAEVSPEDADPSIRSTRVP